MRFVVLLVDFFFDLKLIFKLYSNIIIILLYYSRFGGIFQGAMTIWLVDITIRICNHFHYFWFPLNPRFCFLFKILIFLHLDIYFFCFLFIIFITLLVFIVNLVFLIIGRFFLLNTLSEVLLALFLTFRSFIRLPIAGFIIQVNMMFRVFFMWYMVI